MIHASTKVGSKIDLYGCVFQDVLVYVPSLARIVQNAFRYFRMAYYIRI